MGIWGIMGGGQNHRSVRSSSGGSSSSSSSVAAMGEHHRGPFTTPGPVRGMLVVLDDPHRVFRPAEFIEGQLVVEIRRDLANVRIRLVLCGECKVRPPAAPLRGSRVNTFLERATFLSGGGYTDEQWATAAAADQGTPLNGLSKGTHRFPFRVKVPQKVLSSSIRFERGSVAYFIRCELETLQNGILPETVSFCAQPFQLLRPVDVQPWEKGRSKKVVLQSAGMVMKRGTQQEIADATSSTFTTMSRGLTVQQQPHDNADKTVQITATLPHTGYAIGETIPVTVNVDHYKEYYHSAGIIVTLVRICRVKQGQSMETFRKDICQNIVTLHVDAASGFRFEGTVPLKVPLDAFATSTATAKWFTFQYYVEVMVNLSRKNLVYTESNKLIGGHERGGSEVGSYSGSGIAHGNLHKKVLQLIGAPADVGPIASAVTPTPAPASIDEPSIKYTDMVNVEELKRLRNVTGMSIEIVVGTTRRTKPLPSFNEWMTLDGPVGDAVPEYTPNLQFTAQQGDDKRELEAQRLHELESEPADY